MANEGRVAWAAVEVWAAPPNEERVDWAATMVWTAGSEDRDYVDWAATMIWTSSSANQDYVDWTATMVWAEPANGDALLQGIVLQGRIDVLGWIQGRKTQGQGG